MLLRSGSKGPDVVAVQKALNGLGNRLVVDGDYGPATEKAVKGLQRKHGLVADGVVGLQAWALLFPDSPILGVAGTVRGHAELKPGISRLAGEVLAKFPQLQITSTTGDKHATHSFHYQGRAVDLAGPDMDRIGAWITQHLTSRLAEGIHNPTLSVKNNSHASPSVWGADTWAAHRNHIHLAV
jgi:peptidoglycan hydrolase-like protein with peptidoglycan-binding domain